MASTDKANALPPSSIIFKARGFVPDVRLDVFGTMFHVHSNILKLYSHYFYAYLDAPGSPTTVPGTAFKYDWTTKVLDEGQDWQLVSNNDKAGDLNVEDFKGDSRIQALAFYKLVCAMYSLPFVLQDPDELILLTAMARFYASLPVVSRDLLNTFARNPGFLLAMHDRAVELLVAAKELRHRELFKDCLLLCLGPWEALNSSNSMIRNPSALPLTQGMSYALRFVKLREELSARWVMTFGQAQYRTPLAGPSLMLLGVFITATRKASGDVCHAIIANCSMPMPGISKTTSIILFSHCWRID